MMRTVFIVLIITFSNLTLHFTDHKTSYLMLSTIFYAQNNMSAVFDCSCKRERFFLVLHMLSTRDVQKKNSSEDLPSYSNGRRRRPNAYGSNTNL